MKQSKESWLKIAQKIIQKESRKNCEGINDQTNENYKPSDASIYYGPQSNREKVKWQCEYKYYTSQNE